MSGAFRDFVDEVWHAAESFLFILSSLLPVRRANFAGKTQRFRCVAIGNTPHANVFRTGNGGSMDGGLSEEFGAGSARRRNTT